ncbi:MULTISPECIES: hypothetical protein [Streptomyces]|uniref:hypothetical protein n=1 Tax=Streptomyces TaxID=1883 RepID=UPI00163C2C48|nr:MULTISPECIES: hypothetical protein [Streptomyces]MBC2875617.1 hypothetical protein [Streptomyces sp. TYQ1024]UBI35848.1 hypothetical protein K7I03_04835 [Streptomyces mobaraensis]UKW28442.1 hypothetical protein MCU78_04835 [Streptomyces sp. TYQ1024]
MRRHILTGALAAACLLVPFQAHAAAPAAPAAQSAATVWDKCEAALDSPHESHTNPDVINVHADLKGCKQKMPEYSISVTLYKEGTQVAHDSGSGKNKFKARVVANWPPPKGECHSYSAKATFTIKAEGKTHSASLENHSQGKICIKK